MEIVRTKQHHKRNVCEEKEHTRENQRKSVTAEIIRETRPERETSAHRAHHDVNVGNIEAKVLNNATPGGPKRANRVGLVEVQVCLVLLLEADDLWEIHNRPFHRVHSLDANQYFLPGTT
jgi:hypothetical protein